MSSTSNFNNFGALQPWFTPRLLHPVVVVESSDSVNNIALKNGVDFVQLLRPFSTCQGSIISRTDERRKPVMTTYPFGVRFTKSDCVKPLGNYLVSVTEEHLRHLMIENERDSITAFDRPSGIQEKNTEESLPAQVGYPSVTHADRGTALDAVLQQALLRHSSGDSSDSTNMNIAEEPYFFPSWPTQTEQEKVKREEGGPLPRPQYIEGPARTAGTASPMSPSSPMKTANNSSPIRTVDGFQSSPTRQAAVGSPVRGSSPLSSLNELDVLMHSAVPAWYPPFLRDYHSLVRCGHMDTIDYPVGVMYAVSTREGLAAATPTPNPAWKMTVLQAIRNELMRQHENVQRIWQDSPMMDRDVHSFFILVHDDDHFASSLYPLKPNEVGDLLKECQSLCGTLPHMKNASSTGYDGVRRGDCWTLLTLNSAEDPLRQMDGTYTQSNTKGSGFCKGGALDPMRWVEANTLSNDILSEEGLDAIAASSPDSLLRASEEPYAITHTQLAMRYSPLANCVRIVSTPSPVSNKTYFLPFQWKRRLVRPICGSWNIQCASGASDGTHQDVSNSNNDSLRTIVLPKYTGCYLTEDNIMDIQSSMTSYLAHHLARFIERRVCQLSASISQRRTTTLGKVAAWFKSEEAKPRPEVVLVAKPGSRGGGQVRLRYTSIEMQMRRCGDFCLFLQDFEFAQTNFKLCRDELLESVQNRTLVQPLLGGVQEALSICQLYLMQSPHPLPALPPPYVPSTAHKPTPVNPNTTPLVADSISNPKCYNVCRLEIAQADYLYSSTADNGRDDYLRHYVFKVGLLLFEMCRLHRHSRPAMDRAAVVLSNLLVTGIPKNSSHVWNAVVHQLLAGVYLCMNPPRPLTNIIPLLDIPSSCLPSSSITTASNTITTRDWPVQAHLRRFVYHLHEAGSHWFVECTQRPSSAQAALYCYRRLFICCKSLLHDEAIFAAMKNMSYEGASVSRAQKQWGTASSRQEYWHLTAQRCRNGWRAMLDDIVGKLVFLLLPQQQHYQRERQHISLLSSPNASGLITTNTMSSNPSSAAQNGFLNHDVEEKEKLQQQRQKAEALAILTFAIAHNIRCHLDQAGKDSVLKDVQLLFELQYQCNLVPPCFIYSTGKPLRSLRNSNAPRKINVSTRYTPHGLIAAPPKAEKLSAKDIGNENFDDRNDSCFISGCMILPLIDPNSLMIDLDYYKLDPESKDASRRARVSVGDLLNKEWSLTEETLRRHYHEQSNLKPSSHELPQDHLPSHIFPPYVGDAASLRVGIPGAREHMMNQMKLNRINYPTSPLMHSLTSPTKDGIFHSRTASPSMTSLSLMIGGTNTAGNGVVPPMLFTVPQEQCIWLSLSMVNPLEIPLLLRDLCLVYVIEEEVVKGGFEPEEDARPKAFNAGLEDEYPMNRNNSGQMELDNAEGLPNHGVANGIRREYKTEPCRGSVSDTRLCKSHESMDEDYTKFDLLPFQQKEVRIPFQTAHLPCGPIQVIGLSWTLHLPSSTGAPSSVPHGSSYEGRYYFATAMRGGATHSAAAEVDLSEKADRWNTSNVGTASLSSFTPALLSSLSNTDPFLPNRQTDTSVPLLFHSMASPSTVLNAPENIRLGITPARAAITAKFTPPLPESLYDGEVFSTTLVLQNHSALNGNENSHPSLRYARHVTLQLSPDNACLLYIEGFSQPNMYAGNAVGGTRQKSAPADGSEGLSSTFVVADCIGPGEKIALNVLLRGRYHSVAQAASSSPSTEPCCNDVMLLVGYIPSSSATGTEENTDPSREDMVRAQEKLPAAYQGKGKTSKLNSSHIFPLPVNAVVLHRVHRRVRVDPLMSIYATVLPPWNRSESHSVGLMPVISLSVKNTIPHNQVSVNSFSLTAVTATHGPQWSVACFPFGSECDFLPPQVQKGGAHSLLLTLHRHPFQYGHQAVDSENKLVLVEENCTNPSKNTSSLISSATSTLASGSQNFDPFALESLEARNFLLRTSVVQVGRMGGEPLQAASMSMYVDGGAKNKKGKSDGSAPPEIPLTEDQKRQKAIALEQHIYGRSLEQYTPVALTIHWSLLESESENRPQAELRRPGVVRRGRLYHWIDPLAFLAAIRPPIMNPLLKTDGTLLRKSVSTPLITNSNCDGEDEDEVDANMRGNWQARAARREQQRSMCYVMTQRTAYTNSYQQDHVYRGALAYRVQCRTDSSFVAQWESIAEYKSRSRSAHESAWWTNPHLHTDGEVASISIPITVEISSFAPLPVLVHLFCRLEEGVFLPLSLKSKTFSESVRHPSFIGAKESAGLHSNALNPVWVTTEQEGMPSGGEIHNEYMSSYFYTARAEINGDSEKNQASLCKDTVDSENGGTNTRDPLQNGSLSAAVILPGDSLALHGHIRILVLKKFSPFASRTTNTLDKTIPLCIDTNIFHLKMKTLFFLPPSSGVFSGMSLQALLAVLTKMAHDKQREETEHNLSSGLGDMASTSQNSSFGGSLASSLRAAAAAAAAVEITTEGSVSPLPASMANKTPSLLSCFNPPGFPSSQIAILGGTQSAVVQALLVKPQDVGSDTITKSGIRGAQEYSAEELWEKTADILSRRCAMKFDPFPEAEVYPLASKVIGIVSNNSSEHMEEYSATRGNLSTNVKETPLPLWCASNARFQSCREKVWFPMLEEISDSVYHREV